MLALLRGVGTRRGYPLLVSGRQSMASLFHSFSQRGRGRWVYPLVRVAEEKRRRADACVQSILEGGVADVYNLPWEGDAGDVCTNHPGRDAGDVCTIHRGWEVCWRCDGTAEWDGGDASLMSP